MFSAVHADPMHSDVIAPSPWTIFGCKNGNFLPLFLDKIKLLFEASI